MAAAEKMLMSAELDVAVAAELQRRAGDVSVCVRVRSAQCAARPTPHVPALSQPPPSCPPGEPHTRTYARTPARWHAPPQDVERKDSAKAGGAAGLAGLVFCLPTLLFSQASGPEALASAGLGLGATVVSCFLFGVTYRWGALLHPLG